MHREKKTSMEDTWRPEDLKRHLRDPGDPYVRRRDDKERRHRGGESVERRHKETEKETRRDREKPGERERRHEDGKDRYAKTSKEDSRDRRGDKDRDERDQERERRKERDRRSDNLRESKDRKGDREERHEKERERERDTEREKERTRDRERRNGEERDKRREERDKERHREKDKDRERNRERRDGEDRDKRREERDKERHREKDRERDRERHDREERDRRRDVRDKEKRREERDREHRSDKEKRRPEESRGHAEKSDRHRERERHREDGVERKNDKVRHGDQKEEREQRDEQRRHKEEREKRHKEREYNDQKEKPDSESRPKRSGDEERHHRSDRERTERDKHKERRHRDEEDVDKKPRERQHNKENESDASKKEDKNEKQQTNTVKTEVVVDEEDEAYQEYEDDFEDYEEDFEDVDQSDEDNEGEAEEKEELTPQRRKEIEAIRRAMNEENERVGTSESRPSDATGREDVRQKWTRGSETPSGASQRGRFIDFVAAKQREVSKNVATKQKKRSNELLRLIDLDFSTTASILDLPPVNEYDMYIRTFGTANTKQAYVQCNEDNTDRDVQTEEIELSEKWTQHPPELCGSCGDPNLSQEARDKNMNETNFDSQRLAAFLRAASQVMVVLLEEDQAERNSLRNFKSQTNSLSFSDGSLQLNTKLTFLYDRPVSLLHFSQVQRHTMMSVHMPTATPSAVRLDSCSVICIWNIWEPSRPRKILVYESEVQCCCFSPGKAALVFAGTSVGSVALWDLREPAGNHYRMKIGENEWTFRQPTFSTDAVMADSGHFSSVSSVEVVPSAAAGGLRPEVPHLASEEESAGMSFQLVSLDETGFLHFWVVVELPKASEAGSPSDLGLRPGSKVKLLHSSSLQTSERVSGRDAVKPATLQSLQLTFLPSDSNHFFIGTNMGLVRHGTSHGLKAPPKFYRFQEAGVRPVDVTAVQFSPFRPNLFLVGCSDGSVRLHTVSQEQPVAEWSDSTAGGAVLSLHWAQTRPAVFCVLDSASNLHLWDLQKNHAEPVVTERVSADRVTTMTVFGDSGKQNTYSGVALAHESGSIEMHYFSRKYAVPVLAEEETLENMMSEIS